MPTILITGAGRGIGAELVRQYHDAGWTIIATARSNDDLQTLSEMENVTAIRLDVSVPASVDAFLSALGNTAIDVFVNNAGIYGPREPDRDGWHEVFEINVIAPTLLAQRLKPLVAKSDKKIMAVLTSKMGFITDNGSGGSIPYRSSKAALNAAWKSLAIDWEADGVSVVMLHPGWVQTDMGGPSALIDVKTSVEGLKQRIAETSAFNTGRFVDYAGEIVPW